MFINLPQILSCSSYSTINNYNKIYTNVNDAVKDIKDGSKLLVGGFGLCGIPENLIKAVNSMPVSRLTVVSNNAGILFIKIYFSIFLYSLACKL